MVWRTYLFIWSPCGVKDIYIYVSESIQFWSDFKQNSTSLESPLVYAQGGVECKMRYSGIIPDRGCRRVFGSGVILPTEVQLLTLMSLDRSFPYKSNCVRMFLTSTSPPSPWIDLPKKDLRRKRCPIPAPVPGEGVASTASWRFAVAWTLPDIPIRYERVS